MKNNCSALGNIIRIIDIARSYNALGNIIRIIDTGRSYKKVTNPFDARYLDFAEDSDVNLNPYTSIVDPEFDVPIIVPIVAQTAYSSGASLPTEVDMSLVQDNKAEGGGES